MSLPQQPVLERDAPITLINPYRDKKETHSRKKRIREQEHQKDLDSAVVKDLKEEINNLRRITNTEIFNN